MAAMVRGFEFVPHTADLGLRLQGHSGEDLVRHAVEGFVHLMLAEPSAVRADTRLVIRVEGQSLEDLLVRLLNELIFLFDAKGFLPREATAVNLGGAGLEAEIAGEPYDPSRHEIKAVAKAATYHDLRLVESGGTLAATIYFDL